MNHETLKDNLKKLLEAQDIKVAPFSSKIGLSRETIAQILLGKSKNPGVYTVAKIANALGISVDELIGDKTINIRQSKDVTVINFELLDQIRIYITDSAKKRSSKISMDAIFAGIKETYKFSVSTNQLNKEFADWYIEKYL